ncbi:MAG TPA: PGPGW domain-containing protein [Jatrophihabitantaceae bacterium]|nr:PGPGW domain-containing protein [Jatrophihabitantaceae bacterium]
MSRAAQVPTQQDATPRGLRARILAVRARVRGIPGGFLIWRVFITLVGAIVIAIGIVLLPLPGPGWLIIFAGLGLLATEYAWAATLLRHVRGLLRRWSTWVAAQPRWIQVTMTAFSVLVLAAIVVGAWLLYRSF